MFKDKIGKEINVGDWITYAAISLDSSYLRIGKVNRLYIEEKGYNPGPRISVDSVDDVLPKFRKMKRTTLYFPDRCLVLDEYEVPQSYKDIL